MTRAPLATAAALLATAAAPAQALPGHHYAGGCALATARDGSTAPPTWTGVAAAYVVATDHAGVPAAVPISVDCVLYVNGTDPATVVSASGTGAAAGARPWSYQVANSDVLTLCEVVTVGAGPTTTSCGEGPARQVPPQPVADAVAFALGALDAAFPEAGICDAAPGAPAVAVRTPQGDTYLGGHGFAECSSEAP